MRHVLVLAFFTVATTMTFAQLVEAGLPRRQPEPAVQRGGQGRRTDLRLRHARARGGDVKAQTKQVLDNISATLKTAGSSLANAASMTVYLKNQSDFAAMNEVYRTYWTKDPPARTTVMVPLLNEGLVEIAAVAVPDGGERVVVNPSDWMVSPNPYSYGIKTGNTLFLAGLISRNGKDNTPIKGDMAAQTEDGAGQRRRGAQGRPA